MNLLARTYDVMKKPGVIVGPIAWLIGQIINIIFNVVHSIVGDVNSLGITIILLTIFIRLLMTPISFKQQKSMFKMQALQPQIKKIQDKYKGQTSDPEIQRKMSMEMQKVYSDNNYNQFAGCLPLLIQLPIFMGLYMVMQNPFRYVQEINAVYQQISEIVLSKAASSSAVADLVNEFALLGKVPAGTSVNSDIFSAILNILSPEQVSSLGEAINTKAFGELMLRKNEIEYFLGLNLTETVGLSISPKLAIPVLSAGTTFLSSWIMQRKNSSINQDPNVIQQQRIMNITMPLFMAWITTSLPTGIGVYWITSNIFQILQQLVINKYFEKHPEHIKVVESKLPKNTINKKGR